MNEEFHELFIHNNQIMHLHNGGGADGIALRKTEIWDRLRNTRSGGPGENVRCMPGDETPKELLTVLIHI